MLQKQQNFNLKNNPTEYPIWFNNSKEKHNTTGRYQCHKQPAERPVRHHRQNGTTIYIETNTNKTREQLLNVTDNHQRIT